MPNMGVQLRIGIFILATLAAIFFLWVKVGSNRLGEIAAISFSSKKYGQYVAGRS